MTDYWYRLPARYRAIIEAARGVIPEPIWHQVEHVRFLAGADPVWIGYAPFEKPMEDGRSYRTEWHVSYAHNQMHLPASQRQTTIVIPYHYGTTDPYWARLDVLNMIHELAHVLDEVRDQWRWRAAPVDDYSHRNSVEAYACAFTSWLAPDYGSVYPDYRPEVALSDHATRRHWEEMLDG